MKKITFITGASGVGKTTLVSTLEKKYAGSKNISFLHFDSVGVPSNEDMVKDFGSGENRQKQITFRWIEKMLHDYPDQQFIIFEGQVNLSFVIEGFEKFAFTDYRIVLLDCNDDEMLRRLIEERKQAELANQDMLNRLRYLRNQAREYNALLLDTGHLSPQETVEAFEREFLEEVACPRQ